MTSISALLVLLAILALLALDPFGLVAACGCSGWLDVDDGPSEAGMADG